MKKIGFWSAVTSILLLGLGLGFIYSVWNVLLPFILGVVIAYLFHPLTDPFVAMGLKRSRVVIVLFILLLGATFLFGSWLLPRFLIEANDAFANLSTYTGAVAAIVDNFNQNIQHVLQKLVGERAEAFVIDINVDRWLNNLFTKIPENILNFAHAGLWIFIIPFVCFFALTQGKQWIDSVFQLTPSRHVENMLGLLADINATLGGYIRGLFLESLCIGLYTLLGLYLLGINGAILIGIITAFLNVIPFMALLVGGGIALLAALIQGHGVSVMIGVFLLYIGGRILDDFLIIPVVMGRSVKLHPVILLFSILAGVELGGFLGLLFSIPLAAVIKVTLSIFIQTKRETLITEKQHIYS